MDGSLKAILFIAGLVMLALSGPIYGRGVYLNVVRPKQANQPESAIKAASRKKIVSGLFWLSGVLLILSVLAIMAATLG